MLKNESKNLRMKKLRISATTIRNLTEAEMGEVAGGTYGSLTSGTHHGGRCCASCGCIHTACVCPK